MTEATEGQHPHFLLEGVTETEAYRYPGGGDEGSAIPERDRGRHGGALQGQIEGLRGEAESAREAQQDAGMEDDLGLQVEFESFPDVELAFKTVSGNCLPGDYVGDYVMAFTRREAERPT